MSKTSFEELVNILKPYLDKQVTRMRKPISTVSGCFFLSIIVTQQMPLEYHVVWCHLYIERYQKPLLNFWEKII